MARYTKTKKFKPAIAVIGEGITEQIYFAQLKQYEEINFTLKPALPKHSSIKSIVDKAIELIEKEYDHVFCVFDLDEVNRNPVIRKEYERLKRDYANDRISFIENNPCMEFWFLLHYRRTNRQFENYNQLEKTLKQHIPDYEKTKKYLTAKNIYAFLKEHQSTAKENAEHGMAHAAPTSSKSEVHHILDYLKITSE